jgi:hypothetical protein
MAASEMVASLRVLLVAFVITAASACNGPTRHGDALQARNNFVGHGVSFFTKAKRGGRYGIAFPIVTNTSAKPVTIMRVQLVHVPPSVRVIGYRVLRAEGAAATYLSYEGTGQDGDYLQYPNLLQRDSVRLPPHATPGIFFAADLRAKRVTGEAISGCEFFYRVANGPVVNQTFACHYALHHDRDGTPAH